MNNSKSSNLVRHEKLYLAKQSYDYLKLRLNSCKESEIKNLVSLFNDAEFELLRIIDEMCEVPKIDPWSREALK